ncbi:MAG: BamA/TamA family outer membrane protein [Vicinamibacterales bacterium]
MRGPAFIVLAALLAGLPAFASAQEPEEPATRAEQLRRGREEKAEVLEPPQQGGLEKALLLVENDRILERLLNPAEGFYPRLGTVTPGGGFAAGPAFKRPGLFGGRGTLGVSGMVSIARYWTIDGSLTFPNLADERLFAEFSGQIYDFPSEDFFGLGATSLRRNWAEYGIEGSRFGGRLGARLTPWFSVGGRVDHLAQSIDDLVDPDDIDEDIEDLDDDDELPIGIRFDDVGAPGLLRQPDFLRSEVFAELNYREPRGNPREGGRYFVAFQRFGEKSNQFNFSRVDVDLQQYIPLYTNRRVLALHAHISTSDADEGQRIPFYFQRTLGGPDDLRGYRRFRFRGEHLILLQAEYRWEIFTAVDGAIFYDAGKVTDRRGDLSLGDLESNYGIGFRFGTINGVFLRIEGAFGSNDGQHFVFRFGHVF